jgi:hypothetical protein
MTDKEPITFVTLKPPTQCVLWEQPERLKVRSSDGFFERVNCYENSNHLVRFLYKCRECGQLYFYEWYEWVDWDEGNDRHYITLIPVQTEAEIEALKQTTVYTLLTYSPRLQLDGGKFAWVGK